MTKHTQLDKHLLNLAWSLWTEIGVAGVKREHPNVLILVEELIIFTTVLSEIDPRLRDESLDWCSQFHHFISISRLRSLIKDFDEPVRKLFSQYASTLNHCAKTQWPVFIEMPPINIRLSHKSHLQPHRSSALLNIRARALFGTGARADLVTFFLTHPARDFSIASVAEIGYSKRNLAEVLDDLHFVNLMERFLQGNQQRYRLNPTSPLFQLLDPIPKFAPSWRFIFKILINLRSCIQRMENRAESTKVVELNTCLLQLKDSLQILGLNPPIFENNFSTYLQAVNTWIIESILTNIPSK